MTKPAAAGTQPHDQVAAKFGGKQMIFKINRQDLPAFEAYNGIPAYDLFTRITAGRWTIENIKSVLKFASLPEKKLRELRQYSTTFKLMQTHQYGSLDSFFKENGSHVNATFARNPPAQYAALAQSILAAVLFGIGAEDATFEEENGER